jgi:hypothetical protein
MSEETVTLYNRGIRKFTIAPGKHILPGKKATMTKDQAKVLKGYPDLIDVSEADKTEIIDLKPEKPKQEPQLPATDEGAKETKSEAPSPKRNPKKKGKK